MHFSFWYNRCCVDPVTAVAISKNNPPEHVDFVRYIYPIDTIINGDNDECIHVNRCACDICKGETSAVIIDTTQHFMESALNLHPMLMHIIRLNAEPSSHNVMYTFIIPSIYNLHVLNTIAKRLNALQMFVSTRLNIIDNVEDTSIFKLCVIQRFTPYSALYQYIDWMVEQIEWITNCKPLYYSTRYVTSFTPCSYLAPTLWYK
jgi:hypothetical protein